MPPVKIPARLEDLLEGTDCKTAVSQLADAVGRLVADNKTPFFPAYTDHGSEHLERVLDAAVRLIPDEVWNTALLGERDAAVLACASLLHDVAMHLRAPGFVALVGDRSPYKPRPWFAETQAGRAADLPWPELWRAFQREARHFSASQLERVLGSGASEAPAVAYQDALAPEHWTEGDHLLIGEFLRRHHARLAHEIALYGFPGAPNDFPILAKTMPATAIAEAVGVVARSHNEPLRRMLDYVDAEHGSNQRPAGTALVYHMALLRVADYLQIDADRAPPLLLVLKDPQSPQSVAEWSKHRAVAAVSWRDRDPLALNVEVDSDHPLRTHLALRELLQDLQHELDVAAAVLSEVYSAPDDAALRLTKQRVRSNIDEPALHARLPYVPRRAALRSDPDLFRLMIADLYGDEPAVAGRELLQNAVDAVRARWLWEEQQGREAPDVRDQDADVVVTLVEGDDGQNELRVADRGIGMTPELVIDYYLNAGASFGPTKTEMEGLDRAAALRAIKAGRFGIGAFAAFLLGPEVRVTTRHVEADGVRFVSRLDEDLVELEWVEDVPTGTEVVVPFEMEITPEERRAPGGKGEVHELAVMIAELYRLADPRVTVQLVRDVEVLEVQGLIRDVPAARQRSLPPTWRRVESTSFDDVLWRVPLGRDAPGPHGGVVHNGIVVGRPSDYDLLDSFDWGDPRVSSVLHEPDIAVFDSRHALPLALDRFSLQSQQLPFEHAFLRSIGQDIVAHALAAGMRPHPLGARSLLRPVVSRTGWFPLLPMLLPLYGKGIVLARWTDVGHGQPIGPGPLPFLEPRDSPVSWRRFPHRFEVRFESSRDYFDIDDPGLADDVHRRQLPAELLGAGARLADRVGAWQVASVLLDPEDGAPGQILVRTPRGLAPMGAMEGDPEVPAGMSMIVDDEDVDLALVSALVDACQALDHDDNFETIALTALVIDPEHRSSDLDLLAEEWIDAVDGVLPRSKPKREQTRDAVLARKRKLKPLVKQWTAILDAEAEAERRRRSRARALIRR